MSAPFDFTVPSFHDAAFTYTEYCHEVSTALFEQASAHYSTINPDGTVTNPVLFATVHGSYLYGTAHQNSDLDCYIVIDGVKNKQSVNESGVDVQRFSTAKFLELVDAGSHQAVEALYSPYAVLNNDHPCIPWLSTTAYVYIIQHIGTYAHKIPQRYTHISRYLCTR